MQGKIFGALVLSYVPLYLSYYIFISNVWKKTTNWAIDFCVKSHSINASILCLCLTKYVIFHFRCKSIACMSSIILTIRRYQLKVSSIKYIHNVAWMKNNYNITHFVLRWQLLMLWDMLCKKDQISSERKWKLLHTKVFSLTPNHKIILLGNVF